MSIAGVAIFCKTEFMPIAAEEGLTGVLKCTDAVGCYPIQSDVPNELLQEIDAGELKSFVYDVYWMDRGKSCYDRTFIARWKKSCNN